MNIKRILFYSAGLAIVLTGCAPQNNTLNSPTANLLMDAKLKQLSLDEPKMSSVMWLSKLEQPENPLQESPPPYAFKISPPAPVVNEPPIPLSQGPAYPPNLSDFPTSYRNNLPPGMTGTQSSPSDFTLPSAPSGFDYPSSYQPQPFPGIGSPGSSSAPQISVPQPTGYPDTRQSSNGYGY